MPEKFVDRICGFAFMDETSTGNPKISIILSNVKGIGRVRLFGLQSKKNPKTYKVYRLEDQNKDLFLKVPSKQGASA